MTAFVKKLWQEKNFNFPSFLKISKVEILVPYWYFSLWVLIGMFFVSGRRAQVYPAVSAVRRHKRWVKIRRRHTVSDPGLFRGVTLELILDGGRVASPVEDLGVMMIREQGSA